MTLNHSIHPNVLRFAGWCGIISGIFFLTGVAIQLSSGWYPEDQLEKGNMIDWLNLIGQNQNLILFGILCSIIAIPLFMPMINALYQQLPEDDWRRFAGWSSLMIGIPTAFVVFSLGLGFTWGLFGALENNGAEVLAPIARMGMRGFLVGDDMGTTLIGTFGNGFLAWSALRSKLLPKWICYVGLICALLVFLVLFRYFIPVLAAAAIGYPMILVFYISAGVHFIRKANAGR